MVYKARRVILDALHVNRNRQVSDTRIVIAVDSSESSTEGLDLPERCRIVKLANSVTYDRYKMS